jgi:hypothetical protein
MINKMGSTVTALKPTTIVAGRVKFKMIFCKTIPSVAFNIFIFLNKYATIMISRNCRD